MNEFDFSTFPTLITPRLILRLGVPENAADLFSYLSDPEVMKYNSPSVPMREMAEAVAAIANSRLSFVSKESIIWSIVF